MSIDVRLLTGRIMPTPQQSTEIVEDVEDVRQPESARFTLPPHPIDIPQVEPNPKHNLHVGGVLRPAVTTNHLAPLKILSPAPAASRDWISEKWDIRTYPCALIPADYVSPSGLVSVDINMDLLKLTTISGFSEAHGCDGEPMDGSATVRGRLLVAGGNVTRVAFGDFAQNDKIPWISSPMLRADTYRRTESPYFGDLMLSTDIQDHASLPGGSGVHYLSSWLDAPLDGTYSGGEFIDVAPGRMAIIDITIYRLSSQRISLIDITRVR